MKTTLYAIGLAALATALVFLAFDAGSAEARLAQWHADNQVAVGEWKIEMQTPPCDDVHNLEVIWPKESGQPLSIECNALPVPER